VDAWLEGIDVHQYKHAFIIHYIWEQYLARDHVFSKDELHTFLQKGRSTLLQYQL
jgi:hypothetical protein